MMPTSFNDLERGKGLSAAAAALQATAASLLSSPLLARVCWDEAVPPTSEGLALLPLGHQRGWNVPPSGREGVGQVAMAPCAEQTGAELI